MTFDMVEVIFVTSCVGPIGTRSIVGFQMFFSNLFRSRAVIAIQMTAGHQKRNVVISLVLTTTKRVKNRLSLETEVGRML